MNYLHSTEYTTGKDMLAGEYKEKFQLIESYYIQIYTEESYEVQVTLSQILSDFLLAQEDEKPLVKIIGTDVKQYSIQMLQAEIDRGSKNSILSAWIITGVAIIWCILFFMFTKTFFFSEYKHSTLSIKMDHIYFTFYELILLAVGFLLEFIKSKLIKALFYRQKLITFLRLVFTIPYTIIIIYYIRNWNLVYNPMSIRVPGEIFFVLFLAITLFFIFQIMNGIRKTNAKKKALQEASDILILEQVRCPSCNKEHDCDYPKCPFCGHKYENTTEVI